MVLYIAEVRRTVIVSKAIEAPSHAAAKRQIEMMGPHDVLLSASIVGFETKIVAVRYGNPEPRTPLLLASPLAST